MYIKGLAIKILLMLSLNIIVFIVFALAYLLAIKFKKANWLSAIKFRQSFIAFSISLYVFAVFPIYVSAVIWLAIYFLLREWVFRKDEIRKYQLHLKYGKFSGYPYPRITQIAQFKDAFFPVDDIKIRYKDFKYSFISYSNTALSLIILSLLKITEVSKTVNILYFIEIIIISTAIFIFLARFEYHISLYSPGSISFLCTGLSYISVALFGLVYYFVIIGVLYTIHGTAILSPLL